jgi:hypothetical protein
VLATARTFSLTGIEADAVRVEVDVHRGLPSFSIVGLPDAAVRESRERVRAALVNSGFNFPLQRITANLAPADLRKQGPGFDLAIAAALLAASGQLPGEALGRHALAGELALDGSIRPVPGALAMAEAARAAGMEAIAVAERDAGEAALVRHLRAFPLRNLEQLPDSRAASCVPRAQRRHLSSTGRCPIWQICAASRCCGTRSRWRRRVGTACWCWGRRARASRWRPTASPRCYRRSLSTRRWR